jgi:hypothetical protein
LSHMNVAIPLQGTRWPRTCPCCNAPANSALQIKRSRGMFLVVAATETVVTVNVPYCKPCVRHAEAYRKGTVSALIYPAAMMLFAGFMLGVVGLAVKGGDVGEIGMLFVPAVLLPTLFVAYRVVARVGARVEGPHAQAAPMCRVVGWTQGVVVLECDNPQFAQAVADANPAAARQFS